MALVLNFDGACEPVNPGGVCSGAWIVRRYDVVLVAESRVFYPAGHKLSTNNQAEWCACGFGIVAALKLLNRGEQLEIIGDSALVINQLNRTWGAKHPRMIKLRDQCLQLLEKIDWSARWIPREQNAECDELSRGVTS